VLQVAAELVVTLAMAAAQVMLRDMALTPIAAVVEAAADPIITPAQVAVLVY
jgi:hypothetical protein